MPNPRRSILFTALAALLAGSVVSAAIAVTPTSPNKGQSAGKSAPQGIPEDPATSGSSTEPLSDKLNRQGGVIHPPGDVDPGGNAQHGGWAPYLDCRPATPACSGTREYPRSHTLPVSAPQRIFTRCASARSSS